MNKKLYELLGAKRIVLYGIGYTGKILMQVLDKKGKCYETFDDNVKGGSLDSYDGIVAYDPDLIIVCSVQKEHTERIKASLSKINTKADIFVPNIYLLASMQMIDTITEIDFSIFEKNDFLDALQNGYLNLECEYYYAGKMKDWYSYHNIRIEKNDVVVDCGASCGAIHDSTPNYFIEATENTIYAFEPEPRAYGFLKEEMKEYKKVKVLNVAVGEKNEKMYFHIGKYSDSCIVDQPTENSIEVDVVKIDDVVEGRVDFIKMDIEGAELAALKGAAQTIKKYKPKLAICVYHKPDDILTIPNFIKELNPKYKIWLVNNEGHYWMGTKVFAKVED